MAHPSSTYTGYLDDLYVDWSAVVSNVNNDGSLAKSMVASRGQRTVAIIRELAYLDLASGSPDDAVRLAADALAPAGAATLWMGRSLELVIPGEPLIRVPVSLLCGAFARALLAAEIMCG